MAHFDGGVLLLRATDRRLNLLDRLAECFTDHRNPLWTRHSVRELVSQRVYALALGYEELNDHDRLRDDPLDGPSRLTRIRMYWEAPQIDRPNERPFALHRNGYPGM